MTWKLGRKKSPWGRWSGTLILKNNFNKGEIVTNLQNIYDLISLLEDYGKEQRKRYYKYIKSDFDKNIKFLEEEMNSLKKN